METFHSGNLPEKGKRKPWQISHGQNPKIIYPYMNGKAETEVIILFTFTISFFTTHIMITSLSFRF